MINIKLPKKHKSNRCHAGSSSVGQEDVVHRLVAMSECVLTAISKACERTAITVRDASLPVQITLSVLQALASSIRSHIKVTVLSCHVSAHALVAAGSGSWVFSCAPFVIHTHAHMHTQSHTRSSGAISCCWCHGCTVMCTWALATCMSSSFGSVASMFFCRVHVSAQQILYAVVVASAQVGAFVRQLWQCALECPCGYMCTAESLDSTFSLSVAEGLHIPGRYIMVTGSYTGFPAARHGQCAWSGYDASCASARIPVAFSCAFPPF
jgi:hypothetical protein